MRESGGRLVPDELWGIAEPLVPVPSKPEQGGGIHRTDDRQVRRAIVFVPTTGCAWRRLSPTFGVGHRTAHRRLTVWSEAGLWGKVHRPCSTGSAPSARLRSDTP